MLKKCSGCKLEFDISFFWKDKTKKDGHSCYCQDCDRKKQQKWKDKNPDGMKKATHNWRKNNPDKVKEQHKRQYQKAQQLLDTIKELSGCQLCPENDKDCLDFRHISGKDFEVTHKKSSGYRIILKELQKCCVVCANCHRKIHSGKIANPSKTIDITPYLYLTRDGTID